MTTTLAGTILARRYLLDNELGCSGMWTVYVATDLRTGGHVAVKLLHTFLARDPHYTARLQREATCASRCRRAWCT